MSRLAALLSVSGPFWPAGPFSIVACSLGRARILALRVEGSIGWVGINWAYLKLGVRGVFMNDYPRREARDLEEATPGRWLVRVEGRGKHHLELVGRAMVGKRSLPPDRRCGAGVLEARGAVLPLFCLLYADICAEIPNLDSADTGSLEHMSYVWKLLQQRCPLFLKKGSKSKLGRWYTWESRSLEILPWASTLLLVLLWAGIQHGWWRRFGETPLFVKASDAVGILEVEDGAPAQPTSGHAGSSPDAAPEEAALAAPPVARSDEAVEKKKKTLRNTMHFAATWLAQSKRTRLWRAMPCLEEPLRVCCGKRLVMQKTKGGNRELMLFLADGGYREELCEVFGVLRDSERMRQLKFASAEDLLAGVRRGALD